MSIYAAPNYGMGGDYMMLPGARLDVGPGGKLYETLGDEEAIAIVSKDEAAKAASQPDQAAAAAHAIRKMRRSLAAWLNYRRMNDEVAAGTRKADIPTFVAAKTLARDRDWAGEQRLADDLYLLLSKVYSSSSLPVPDVSADPDAAVKLATMAIKGRDPSAASGAQATGIWPLIIIGAGAVLLFTATSFISNRAEVQKEKERIKCIRDGACTDYGFWLKAAATVTIGWFVWDKLGVGERVRGAIKGGRRRRR